MNVGFDSISGGGGDIDVSTVGIGAEFKLANSPLSVFGKFERLNVSGSTSGSANLFFAGAKWNVGAQTLLQRGQAGASLDPIGGMLLFIH